MAINAEIWWALSSGKNRGREIIFEVRLTSL